MVLRNVLKLQRKKNLKRYRKSTPNLVLCNPVVVSTLLRNFLKKSKSHKATVVSADNQTENFRLANEANIDFNNQETDKKQALNDVEECRDKEKNQEADNGT